MIGLSFDDDLEDVDPEADDVGEDDWPPGKGHDPRCGAIWSGFRIEHCMICHRTFSGSSTGDAHRVGPYVHDQRRCLSDEELAGLGLWVQTNAYGTQIWHGRPNRAGIEHHHPLKGTDDGSSD